tara:strand:- start:263 stop:478 length:216 start_codon:yes stop_codon:yes gene_type:complete
MMKKKSLPSTHASNSLHCCIWFFFMIDRMDMSFSSAEDIANMGMDVLALLGNGKEIRECTTEYVDVFVESF